MDYVDEVIEGKYAKVVAKVVSQKRDDITVEYRMKNKKDNWIVYDLKVEGMSLVKNYRDQFNTIIQKSSFKGLIQELEQKVLKGTSVITD